MTTIQSFIQQLPKAECHLHIEGTLEPELLFELAAKNNVNIPFQTIEQARAAYQFNDLQSFLDIYYQGMNVLKTEADFYQLANAYFQTAKQNNICSTEFFFDPQAHLKRGVNFDAIINGLYAACQDAEKNLNITSHIIMCFLRDESVESASATLALALNHGDKIIAVGLDSAELDHPPKKFTTIFAAANAAGFKAVAHAGEEGPASYIWQAIRELQVDRIDHGIRCVEDAELVDYLKQTQIPLTMCPLSNLKLKNIPSLTQYPAKQLLDLGLVITVNSDDPAYFQGYVNDNLMALVEPLGLCPNDIALFCKNSFKASFISDQQKQRYWRQIDELLQSSQT